MTTPVTYTFEGPVGVAAAVAAVPRHMEFVSGTTGTLSAPLGSLGYTPAVACTLFGVELTAGSTKPTGQAVIVDVLKNGATIYTVSLNKPQLAPGAANSFTPAANASVTAFSSTDVLTTNITQVGNPVAGVGLTVQVYLIPSV